MENSNPKRSYQWITFIGFILLLVGIYGSVRTAINLLAFDKYPQGGVIHFDVFNNPYVTMPVQREQDCTYPGLYYKEDGRTTRPPTEEEKNQEKTNQQNCLDSVKESRNRAKIDDISQSLLFLFLGAGVLSSKRIFSS